LGEDRPSIDVHRIAMVQPKEFKRVMAIARAHARDALTKHDTQRESYFAYCRNNWKRYAASFTRSKAEGERFAATLDRATRDLVALAEAAPNPEAAAEILRSEQPPAWEDSIEGAMDSVITYEAHQQAEETPEAHETPIAEDSLSLHQVEAASAPSAPPLLETTPPPARSDEHSAEEEDRLAARFGFRSPADADSSGPTAEPPQHAQELQRKVRAVLLAHRPKIGG
jgi:hypothetical protein